MHRYISLGAGVQSTTMLLMAVRGTFGDVPQGAIFADTHAEPEAVYRHLDWLTAELAPFPIHRVSAGDLYADTIRKAEGGSTRIASIPSFVATPKGKGMLKRQCTKDFKLRPIRRKLRELANGEPSESWIGISFDEYHRMKQSDVKWVSNRYPLVDHKITRWDCIAWLKEHGYPIPMKSSCVFCPYHDDGLWRELQRDHPADFERAVTVDRAIRQIPRIDGETFLHDSLQPLIEIDFRTREEQGQINMWANECEGLCGV